MVLPFPPSLNTYWRSVPGKGVLISEKGRQYRSAVQALAASQNWPKFGEARLSVHIEAWAPDKRRRDLDNMLKAALDALTHCGVWNDDSQIDDLRIVRAPMVGGMLKIQVNARDSALLVAR
jgi:crossover junction endodeoxyribonuclease RusA